MLKSQAASLGFSTLGQMESAQIHALKGRDSPQPRQGLPAQDFPRSAQREPRVLWLGDRATVPKEEGRLVSGRTLGLQASLWTECSVYRLDFF